MLLTRNFVSRRYGLIFPWGLKPPPSAPGKDMYLITLPAREPFPEFLEILDHVTIPTKRRENMLIGVFILNKGRIAVPPPLELATSATTIASADHPATSTVTFQPPLQNDAISSLFSNLGTGPPQPAMPFGSGGPPGPLIPGMMAPLPPAGLGYPYPPPPMTAPPPPPVAPPVDALTALASSTKNMTRDQISLILKGLTMVNPPPVAPSWAPPGILVANPAYVSGITSHDSFPSSSRSPQYVFVY
jgi:hypothetical protein